MRLTVILSLVLMLAAIVPAQRALEITGAPGGFRVEVTVAGCDRGSCAGEAVFTLHRKGAKAPPQVIKLPETEFELPYGSPADTKTLAYDSQYILSFKDVNFDGVADLSITNGRNGSYGARTFNIYLANAASTRFTYNKRFSELTEKMGMFDIDRRKRTLEVTDKSGCCFHSRELYDVVGNRPRLIFEEVEDAFHDPERVKTTTRRLVRGKWKTAIKYKKQSG